ncbi:hypothetical protein GIB67_032626 [Kingdonia uniflora]|uniref:Homeobox domain-containing protein n=1 Tax=Kingdonia uniflora TaxID=39325 RepID=A0A7J7P9I2_9MAGN|nr:hypothetical protein GIB67_032626 [Kingdonia uniflora]
MADEEPYHVPQRSRRDKLRVIPSHEHDDDEEEEEEASCSSFKRALYYDPSLLLLGGGESLKQNPLFVSSSTVKQEVSNFMPYASNSYLLDPQSSLLALHVNPTSIQQGNNNSNNNNNNPFLYSSQHLRYLQDNISFRPPQQTLDDYRSSFDKGLSLSLSSNQTHHLQQYDNPNSVFGGKGIDGYVIRGIIGDAGASCSTDVRSPVPLGPFTGYASVLKRSRFLKPAQQLMEEHCDVVQGVFVERSCGDFSLLDPPDILGVTKGGGDDQNEYGRKKNKLIAMLDEVYRRYKVYYQQMQAIVASFESVSGLGNAAPYTSIAIKAMSKHFKSLKNSIIDQLRCTSKAVGNEGSTIKGDSLKLGDANRRAHGPKPSHNLRIQENHPVWRPQRGLPDRAVAVLKAWLFEHFLHPYPTDNDKHMLARETGLSRSQVSNWFINARVRLWKPMVEEIHMLDTQQNELKDDENVAPDKPPQDNTLKRSRDQLVQTPDKSNEPTTEFSYNNLSSSHHDQFGVGVSNAGGNSGVSLTLGLRQNHGIGLREAFQMDVARSLGLGGSSDQGYIMGGFEPQNHHYVKDFGGRLLHDFVG